jgi:F0F1-type ATP synthase epsilon subunit
MPEGLHMAIRTPHEVVFDGFVRSARVPVETGQVGLRPRLEPTVLAIEPGLVILKLEGDDRFAATAGGLLMSEPALTVLYTPYAAVSSSGQEVLDALERALETPDSDLAARRELGELERHILRELGERRRRRHE